MKLATILLFMLAQIGTPIERPNFFDEPYNTCISWMESSGVGTIFCSHLPVRSLPPVLLPLPEPSPPQAITFAGSGICWHSPVPNCEGPVDVPAIQETYEIGLMTCHASPDCEGKGPSCNMSVCEKVRNQVWTCADKSRVLLTAEDGTRHCVRF